MILVLSMVRKHPLIQPEVCTSTVLQGSEKPTLGVNAQEASPGSPLPRKNSLLLSTGVMVRAKSDTKLD